MSADEPFTTDVVLRRYAQFLLDRLLLFVVTVLLLAASLFLALLGLRAGWPRWVLYVPVAVFIVLVLGGNLWIDVWRPYRSGGATPAMRWLGLRIVTLDGGLPTLRAYCVRWLLLVVDGLLLGIGGAVMIAVTERHQRLGDMVAGTLVVRVR